MKEFRNFDEFITFWLNNPKGELVFKSYYTNNCILYFKNIASLPIARLDGDTLLIGLTIVHKKTIKKLILALSKLTFKYFLVYNFIKQHTNKDEFSIRYEDLDNVIDNYIIKEFYYLFKEIDFNIQEHIFKYITNYDCYPVWNQVHEYKIKKIIGRKSYMTVDSEIVADISNIDRNFKIFSFLE